MPAPRIEPGQPLIFLINAAAGRNDPQNQRTLIESTFSQAGLSAEIVMASPEQLPELAAQAAEKAHRLGTAIVAVGGDGTVNTVAQAAHAQGCVMGVVAQGTFNYFARTHGIPTDPTQALLGLLDADVEPVQVATVNRKVFLVNASLGLYPELLEDREAYKAKFGRSRFVALAAACITLLRSRRQLRLHIELDGTEYDVRTPTLFVGNNRLQLDQFGVQASACRTQAFEEGRVAAIMLKPIGTGAMLRLILHGAMGTLGEADDVQSFQFDHMLVHPGQRRVKVAMDGEVSWLRSPIEFLVPSKPLFLLQPRVVKDAPEASA
ncbi:diacylglycerol kinase family protein [Variovorax sp. PCZ-1]|uniref:diacylglycerol/lipid kinase family protein n=1 Tax=Variovorax sp. PCZ-1 TaxID=2835533 RepID=UPI001BCC5ED0|nr:diacylglycerol kinase family protein [Variovorax sp. PCZ-1]MBS7806759.1 diacylglycerol kinase [Variovorax sp. PCZ-1]